MTNGDWFITVSNEETLLFPIPQIMACGAVQADHQFPAKQQSVQSRYGMRRPDFHMHSRQARRLSAGSTHRESLAQRALFAVGWFTPRGRNAFMRVAKCVRAMDVLDGGGCRKEYSTLRCGCLAVLGPTGLHCNSSAAARLLPACSTAQYE